MSFLTIPNQDDLFTTVKTAKSAQAGADSMTSVGGEDSNDEDEEEDDEEYDVRLIPRCSPVPRKRGSSIYDETAEYMRIQQDFSSEKRVLFADSTGADLVEVKEFVAFDSDEEEDTANRWEEEEAKYRKPDREPTFHLQPEFIAPSASLLLQALKAQKVEVEQISPVEDEPLGFKAFVRVLNISFQKAVYIRATMDSWASYFDHPAEYVQGSNDGDTDQFFVKLSFAPPYITHGSRIEFVVRYETSDGDFWANNSHMNYVVTLLLSYEDNSPRPDTDRQQVKGILRPPKDYSMGAYFDSDYELEKDDGTVRKRLFPVSDTAVCPVIMQPEIDLEIAVHPPAPSVPTNQEHSSADGTRLAYAALSPGEHSPRLSSSQTTLQTNSSFVLCASESVQPKKSQPLPRLHCELGNQTSGQPVHGKPYAPLTAPTPALHREPRPGSDLSQEIHPSDASNGHLPISETKRNGRPCIIKSPVKIVLTLPDDAEGFNELDSGLSEGSSRSVLPCDSSMSTLWSVVADSQEAALVTEGEAQQSSEVVENPSVRPGVATQSQHWALQSASAREEKEDVLRVSPGTVLDNLADTSSQVSVVEPETDVSRRSLMPAVLFLSGAVTVSVVLQEPSTLFIMGLLLVLRRLSLCRKSFS